MIQQFVIYMEGWRFTDKYPAASQKVLHFMVKGM
jgi:hypothetical protein